MTMISDPILPTAQDAEIARESSKKLARLGAVRAEAVEVQVAMRSHKMEKITLPRTVVRLLMDALREMGEGNALTLIPIHAQLTTQQAAEILGVSRPFLIKELKEKKLRYQKVGTHRRIRFKDLMDYRRRHLEAHNLAMDELVRQAQELNLGY